MQTGRSASGRPDSLQTAAMDDGSTSGTGQDAGAPIDPYRSSWLPPSGPVVDPAVSQLPLDAWAPPPSPVHPAAAPRRLSAPVLVGIGAVGAAIVILAAFAAQRLVATPLHITQPARGGTSSINQPVIAPPIDLPAALTATAPAGSPTVVTPVMAKNAVLAMWPVREAVLSARTAASLDQIETGTALTGDRDRVFCGCLEAQMLLATNSVQVYVPRQTTWPAHFVAEVHLGSPQQPFREYLVFTRAGFAVPWKVAFAAGAQFSGATTIDVGERDKDGYTTSLPAGVQASVGQLPAALAAAFQTAKESGRPTLPGSFAPGAWTSSLLDKIVQTPQGGRIGGSGPKLTVHYFTYPADAVIAVPLTDGRTLACGVVRQTADYTAPYGRLVQDSAQRSWPPTLSPGQYRKVTATGQLQTCFLVSTGGDPVVVSGGDLDSEKWYDGIK